MEPNLQSLETPTGGSNLNPQRPLVSAWEISVCCVVLGVGSCRFPWEKGKVDKQEKRQLGEWKETFLKGCFLHFPSSSLWEVRFLVIFTLKTTFKWCLVFYKWIHIKFITRDKSFHLENNLANKTAEPVFKIRDNCSF